jgi:hypothetical protein
MKLWTSTLLRCIVVVAAILGLLLSLPDSIHATVARSPAAQGSQTGWGTWSGAHSVPGWFGDEDQGAGVAIGNINGNSQPDLIVFHIDNPDGENAGYYRIGWDLDTNALPTGSWSNIKQVPGWFGWEDQGGGIAITDINGNSQPDLIVFHIDNPDGENAGYYRIGWDLDINGDTSNWSNIKQVPGWFGWEDQGGDISIWDFNNNNRPDLIVFHIDNPGGENAGYYRIGWDLDINGDTSNWSNIKQVPGWFGSDDQGGGITAFNNFGDSCLAVYHIDNPVGANSGYLRTTVVNQNGDPAGSGWSVPLLTPVGTTGVENHEAAAATGFITGGYGNRRDLIIFYINNLGGANIGRTHLAEGLIGC